MEMAISKQTLHNLIDNVEEREVEILYHLLMKFVPTVPPLPDEIEALNRPRGKTFNHKDIDWNNLDKMDLD